MKEKANYSKNNKIELFLAFQRKAKNERKKTSFGTIPDDLSETISTDSNPIPHTGVNHRGPVSRNFRMAHGKCSWLARKVPVLATHGLFRVLRGGQRFYLFQCLFRLRFS